MPDLAGTKTSYYGFTGPIDPGSATRIGSALNHAVNNGSDEIYLCLSSTGGYVADGIFLYNHIRSLPVKVIIHNTGTVMSIATAVYVAAERRYCSEHGVFMIHPTEMPALASMRAEQLQSSLTAALADDKRTEDILRERASIPDAHLVDRRFREVYITAEEALEFGLVQRYQRVFSPKGERNLSDLMVPSASYDSSLGIRGDEKACHTDRSVSSRTNPQAPNY